MSPPESVHAYYPLWSLSFLRGNFVIYPSIDLAIIFECTLSKKLCTSVGWFPWPSDELLRPDTVKGLGIGATTFTINVSPKYPCAWFCISLSWICYITLKMLFSPLAVPTMNARHTQTYLLAKLRKWSTMSLAFETEISSLYVSLSISLVAWR